MYNTKTDAIVGHPVEVYVMREPYNRVNADYMGRPVIWV